MKKILVLIFLFCQIGFCLDVNTPPCNLSEYVYVGYPSSGDYDYSYRYYFPYPGSSPFFYYCSSPNKPDVSRKITVLPVYYFSLSHWRAWEGHFSLHATPSVAYSSCIEDSDGSFFLQIYGSSTIIQAQYIPVFSDTFDSIYARALSLVPSTSNYGSDHFVRNSPGFFNQYCGASEVCDDGKYFNTKTKKCEQKVTRIYYFNGIMNTNEDADDGKRFIASIYNDKYKGQKKETYIHDKLEFETAYNFSFGFVYDLVEVFSQKYAEKAGKSITMAQANEVMKKCQQERWIKSDPRCLDYVKMKDEIKEEMKNLMGRYGFKDIESLNTSILMQNVKNSLEKGERVIIVAHSQGNIFANYVLFEMQKEYPNQIGMIGVASAAGLKSNKNYYYVTANDDLVINALRAYNWLLSAGLEILPSNVNNDIPCAFAARDFFNHSLYYGYFFNGIVNIAYWWKDTEFEFLLGAGNDCPAGSYTVALPSRGLIDAYFDKLIKTLKYPGEWENK
ncbi:MAG: hypothetical protein LBU73_08560 [Helicobacteraceae bacterium]|jgi:hypothetical protein|nr:hypothetical protein [Helicobacteraceae bacterium]